MHLLSREKGTSSNHPLFKGCVLFRRELICSFFNSTSTHLVGGWTNPSETYSSSNWIISHLFTRYGCKLKSVWVATPPSHVHPLLNRQTPSISISTRPFREKKQQTAPALRNLLSLRKPRRLVKISCAKGGSFFGEALWLRNLFDYNYRPFCCRIRRATKKLVPALYLLNNETWMKIRPYMVVWFIIKILKPLLRWFATTVSRFD